MVNLNLLYLRVFSPENALYFCETRMLTSVFLNCSNVQAIEPVLSQVLGI